MTKKPQRKVPEVRFKGFTDDWEQRKFGSLFTKDKERNKGKQFNYSQTLSVSKMTLNRKGNGASSTSLTNYKVLRLGDVAFEGHSNSNFSYGRFVVNDNQNGIISPRFAALRPTKQIDINYWKNYLHNESIMKYVLVKSTKSGTMMNELVYSDLYRQKINVPNKEEQYKIGKLLQLLESFIDLQQEKLRQIKLLKKALLQKMFADKNNRQPILRFLGFYDDWALRKLGEFADVIDPHPSHRAPKATNRGIPFIGIGDVDTDGYINNKNVRIVAEDNYDIDQERYNLNKPSLAISRVASVGKVVHLRNDIGKYVISPTLSIVQTDDKSNLDYLFNYLSSKGFQQRFKSLSSGSTRQSVGIKDLRLINIFLPDRSTELKKINDTYEFVNNLLVLQQRKLRMFQLLKKFLLSQLFI